MSAPHSPKLKFIGGQTEYLLVNAGQATYQTQVFTDMDQVVKADFNNELPIVITKTIIAAATKAAIAYGLNKGTEKNLYANISVRAIAGIYQACMNQADLRTWVTLPKQYQAARFPTPDDRQITLALPNGLSLPPIPLIDGVINVVCVKCVQSGQTPVVQQFKFGEMIARVPDPIKIRTSAATELPADK